MKPPLLFSLLALALPVVSSAADPVYDIGPATTEGRNQDARKDPWELHSFRVLTFAGKPGEASGSMEIGRDDKGLIIRVHGASYSTGPTTGDNPDKWNSVEIFVGGKKGFGQYYEAIIAPDGFDPASGTIKPRIVIKDFRDPAPDHKPEVQVTEMSVNKEGGYLEVRLPWSNLGLTPKIGDEASLQVYINSIDETGRRHTLGWHPEYRVHTDPAAMYRIRIAEKSSPPAKMAVRVSLDFGQPRVDVYGGPLGGLVEARENGKAVASGAFERMFGPDQATMIVPPTATEVFSKDLGTMPIDFTELPDMVTAGILNLHLVFKPFVFSGEKFPTCDIDPETEKLLGRCELTVKYYDADYNEVKTATKPGRYGAIVQVSRWIDWNDKATQPDQVMQKFNRFVTLYRAPEELLGRILRPEFTDVKLPPELGIDPTVVSSHMRSVGDLFGYEFNTSAGLNRGPDAAILLAWLSETKADAPDLHRTGPSAADQLWWYGLKKKTNNLRHDYFVHLPPDYDKDPDKKWPVILFLHGSGERGYDLKLLARQPLVQDIDKRKDFPFILIAPQCSPGEWWSIPELDDLLDGLPAKYRIDPDRIYLTGLSMGGFATWAYLAAEPGRFAAAVPICGGGDPEDAARFKDVPIWVFHGEIDDAVPIQRSQEMVDALKKLGSNVQYTTYPGVDHFSWIPTYKNPDLFKWLLKQKRK